LKGAGTNIQLARLKSLKRIGNVGPRHDGISLEDAACAPAADLHDDAFGVSGAAQIQPRNLWNLQAAPSLVVMESITM